MAFKTNKSRNYVIVRKIVQYQMQFCILCHLYILKNTILTIFVLSYNSLKKFQFQSKQDFSSLLLSKIVCLDRALRFSKILAYLILTITNNSETSLLVILFLIYHSNQPQTSIFVYRASPFTVHFVLSHFSHGLQSRILLSSYLLSSCRNVWPTNFHLSLTID